MISLRAATEYLQNTLTARPRTQRRQSAVETQRTRTLAAAAFLRHPVIPIALGLVEVRLRIWAAGVGLPVPAVATVSAAAPKPRAVTVCAAAARSMTIVGSAEEMRPLVALRLIGK